MRSSNRKVLSFSHSRSSQNYIYKKCHFSLNQLTLLSKRFFLKLKFDGDHVSTFKVKNWTKFITIAHVRSLGATEYTVAI